MNHCLHRYGTRLRCCWCGLTEEVEAGSTRDGHGPFSPENSRPVGTIPVTCLYRPKDDKR